MNFSYQGLNINYTRLGKGYPLVLLHGWGVDSEIMLPVAKGLMQSFTVYSLDFPGFGGSDEPKDVWGTAEYAAMTKAWLRTLSLDEPIVVAHSFGGRIALRLAAEGLLHKLIITGGAGLRPKRTAKYYVKVYSYKFCKHLLALPFFKNCREEILAKRRAAAGSDDYRRASGIMRQIFVRVVNEDLGFLLSQISCPTLLFWGECDTATPLKDGQRMEKAIPDAGLVTVYGSHYAFLEKLDYFLLVLDNFLAPEKEQQ